MPILIMYGSDHYTIQWVERTKERANLSEPEWSGHSGSEVENM